MDSLIKKLNINEAYTKPIIKPKHWTNVKYNIPLLEDYNVMADLLFLPMTKEGYRYLLVVVDLANDEFDIEPIKNKQSDTVLNALKTIFKRKYIKKPYASFNTDAGVEFKGDVDKYLKKENIYHKSGVPGRHSQMANVERLNRTLGRLFNGYMGTKEEDSGKTYNEWTDIVKIVRLDLNKIRKKSLPNIFKIDYKVPSTENAKYHVGDIVYYQLDKPMNRLGKEEKDEKFRMGDLRWSLAPKKIMAVFSYPGKVPYRYQLEGKTNVSYTATQLQKSNEQESKFIVKQIIDKRKHNGKVEYKVWWKGYTKASASWESRVKLIEDGLQSHINEYNKNNKK